MSAYLIALVDIRDPEAYRAYAARTPAIIAKYGGRLLVRGGETATLEGEPFSGRLVIVEFPTLEHVKEFYASPEYRDAKLLREGVSTARFLAAQGI